MSYSLPGVLTITMFLCWCIISDFLKVNSKVFNGPSIPAHLD
jgi:hypothetical protein